MRIFPIVLAGLLAATGALAQTPPAAPVQALAAGRRSPAVQTMILTSSSWTDGGMIPEKYTQPGHDVSPQLSWDKVPEGTESFVLIARDLDFITPAGADGFLHWMLWNMPKTARSLAEGAPALEQLPDGTRQISSSGPYYKGPAAPSYGPAHHYVFEIYAVSAGVAVPAVGQSPTLTKAAVEAAMAGKILGKGVFSGIFKRP